MLVVALALLFLIPWTLAVGSFAAAVRYGWPGPYGLGISGLQAEEEMVGVALAGGVAALVLVGGVLLVAAAARRFGLPAVPTAAISAAVVLVVPTVIALALVL